MVHERRGAGLGERRASHRHGLAEVIELTFIDEMSVELRFFKKSRGAFTLWTGMNEEVTSYCRSILI